MLLRYDELMEKFKEEHGDEDEMELLLDKMADMELAKREIEV